MTDSEKIEHAKCLVKRALEQARELGVNVILWQNVEVDDEASECSFLYSSGNKQLVDGDLFVDGKRAEP